MADARVSGVKILLFLYCFGYRKASSQVRMLWEDHRNDLFINGFGECGVWTTRTGHSRVWGRTGLLMSAGGSKLRWCEC